LSPTARAVIKIARSFAIVGRLGTAGRSEGFSFECYTRSRFVAHLRAICTTAADREFGRGVLKGSVFRYFIAAELCIITRVRDW